MIRKSNPKRNDSAAKPQKQAISSKEALLASSAELKLLLGNKFDKMKTRQSKYLQPRFRPTAIKTSHLEEGDTTIDSRSPIEPDALQPLNMDLPKKSLNVERYSQKVVGCTSLRKPNSQKKNQEEIPTMAKQMSLNKGQLYGARSNRNTARLVGLSETQLNSLRRRCRNFNSHTILSTSLKNHQKRGRTGYYISEIRNSVSQFKNNEEFMDAHLTHLMQSVETFKMFSCSYLPSKPHKIVQLPPISENKITIVFDLDETLVHSQAIDWTTEGEQQWGTTVDIHNQNCKYQVNLKIRPFAKQVLQRLVQKFQIGVITAGQEHYGSRLLDQLDPEGKIFSFKLYRPHCLQMQSRISHVKDLRVLGNRSLSKVVLIDNSPHSYIFQKKNGIPIVSFYEDKDDTELLKLQQFLLTLQGATDVQKVLHHHFRLQDYNRYNCLTKLVEQLY